MNTHLEETTVPNPSPRLRLVESADVAAPPARPVALGAAAIAAALGAALWTLLAWKTGYEIGYVAWAIGGMVGFAATRLGGRGAATAVFGAVAALAAILGGKLMATHLAVESELSAIHASYDSFTYAEASADAAGFAGIDAASDAQLAQFMVDHAYTDASDATGVAPADLEGFRTYAAPHLVEFQASQPSFEEWRDESYAAFVRDFRSEFSLLQAVIDNMNLIDLVFALLGVTTAYGMIARAS